MKILILLIILFISIGIQGEWKEKFKERLNEDYHNEIRVNMRNNEITTGYVNTIDSILYKINLYDYNGAKT